MPPKPLGPSQGGVPAQNLFDWNNTTRVADRQHDAAAGPGRRPAPQPQAAQQSAAPQQVLPPASERRDQLRGAEQRGARHAAQRRRRERGREHAVNAPTPAGTHVTSSGAPSPLAARLVPYGFARTGQILVAHQHADSIEVWISERTSDAALAEVARNFGALSIVRMPADELAAAINSAYARNDGSAAQVVGEVEGEVDLSRLMQDIPEVEDLLESEDDAPIIRMINALLTQAAREQASDIHIEPFENASVVRFRVDGTLRDVVRPKKALHGALISRIKIMAQLDIAEKRLPQDGRITLRVGGRPVDVRVSTLPTGHGERAVLRLLEKDAQRLNLETLGMARDTLVHFDKLIGRPHGIVLVTGPTGSGKTTTLYAVDVAARNDDHQHHDGGRPDRIRPVGHRPDAGERAHRHDVRARVALDSAAGPGHHHDR